MKHLFKYQFPIRNNKILLKYGDNLHKFTFLQTEPNSIKQQIIKTHLIKNLSFPSKILKSKENIQSILQYDFTQQELNMTENYTQSKVSYLRNQLNFQKNWRKNQLIFKQVSQSFEEMKSFLYNDLSQENLIQTIQILQKFNCIDIKFWAKIFSYVSAHYKKEKLQNRNFMIISLSSYFRKFIHTYEMNMATPYKFMYPQNYMIDLVNFRSFYKSIQDQRDFITGTQNNDEQRLKLQILESKIYLIMKATKKVDMNIYQIRSFFAKRKKQMIQIASKYKCSLIHQRLLYNIYYIFSYLHQPEQNFYEEIQTYYYQYFLKIITNTSANPQKNALLNKSKQINKLLSIWKLNNRPNLQIYNQVIQPFIKDILQNNLLNKYYSILGMNILCSGIKDPQTLNVLIKKCDITQVKQDELLHMLKHYFNIYNKDSSYQSNYQKCSSFQNIDVLKYLKDKQVTLHSSCMHYPQINDTSRKQKRIFQYHKSEKLWSKLIKNIFQPKYKVYQGVSFCNYQIDYLVLTKQKMIAFEIEGGHYNKKQYNKSSEGSEQIKSTGKKIIRDEILKGYGINAIRIHCEQKVPTYIMQSHNLQIGKQYIENRIKEVLKVSLKELF